MTSRTTPSSLRLQGHSSTPDIRSSSTRNKNASTGKSKIGTRLSVPSLRAGRNPDGDETKSQSSPIKNQKARNNKRGHAANESSIYSPPSSLATPRSRSQSSVLPRARTPSIKQQTEILIPDRQTRQTNVYLNIITAPPPTSSRSPLGAINPTKLQPPPGPFIGNYDTGWESIWHGRFEHSGFTSSPRPEPEFERVDENQREVINSGQSELSDFPSSPPLKIELDEAEEMSEEEYWLQMPLLRDANQPKADTPPFPKTPPTADLNTLQPDENLADPTETCQENQVSTADARDGPLWEIDWNDCDKPSVQLMSPARNPTKITTNTQRNISFLTNEEVFKLYRTFYFDTFPKWQRIAQVHEVHKERSIEFDWLLPEDRDAWFMPAMAGNPLKLRQQWRNCTTSDGHLIRDVYCAFYVALSKAIAVAHDTALKLHISTASGWMEIAVDPLMLISEMRKVLKWDDGIIDKVRFEHGLDLFQFIDAQYELKSKSSMQGPDIDLTNGQDGPVYALTCKRKQTGQYKLRFSPPYIQNQWSIKHIGQEVECTLKPSIWHPHFVFSKTDSIPRFTCGKDTDWLHWDQKQRCFRGIIPRNYPAEKDELGCTYVHAEITADYNQCFWGRKPKGSDFFYLWESITSHSKCFIPARAATEPKPTPADLLNLYRPNPLQFLWSSHKLGFQERHSKFMAGKAREYELEMFLGRGSNDARNFTTYGVFPWDPKEPRIQSWGEVKWIDFLKQRRARAEYLRNDPRGRIEVIRSLKEPRYGNLDQEHDGEARLIDEDLEEMRRMYENLYHEAQAVVWLNTLYRETFQERLEDESLDMEKIGLRSFNKPTKSGTKGKSVGFKMD